MIWFTAPHHNYSEAEVDRYETGDAQRPALFISRDRLCVFVQEEADEPLPKVHLADQDEINALWESHHIAALLAVMHRKGWQ